MNFDLADSEVLILIKQPTQHDSPRQEGDKYVRKVRALAEECGVHQVRDSGKKISTQVGINFTRVRHSVVVLCLPASAQPVL